MNKKNNLKIILGALALYTCFYLVGICTNFTRTDFTILNFLKIFISVILYSVIPLYYFLKKRQNKNNKFLDNILIASAFIPTIGWLIPFKFQWNIRLGFAVDIVYFVFLTVALYKEKFSDRQINLIAIIATLLLIIETMNFILEINVWNLANTINIVTAILLLIAKLLIINYLRNDNLKTSKTK